MKTKLEPLEYKSLQSGLLTESSVSEHRQPIDSVSEVVNFNFDRIGSAKLRKGQTRLGNQLSGSILGLYEFRDSGNGSNNQIITVNGTVAYYLSSGTWTSKRTSLTASSKARFSTFLDYVFMVNGTEATAIWDGNPSNSFLTTGNAASAPTGKFIENFRSRMWIAGNTSYPDRVYFSSTPSSVTTPIITWDTAVDTGQWIDIAPSDGENITALKRDKTALLVFKNNHIYRIYSISSTEPDPTINVGTYSNESVVATKDGVYFHHPTGFYKYSSGAVQEISRPIIDFIENISLSNYTSVCGWQDGDHIYWSVGDVTIDDITYTDIVCRYTISTQVWTIYSYPTKALFSSSYNDGTNIYYLVGDDNGNILKINTGNTDNGTAISYSLTSRWYSVDGLLGKDKIINSMVFFHNKGTGTKVYYQNENNRWIPIGDFKDLDTFFQNANVKGRKVRFKISGTSKGEPFIYDGFEIHEGSTELTTH